MSGVALKLKPLELCFAISKDDTWASLTVTYGERTLDLGPELHHHCLVLLARRRLADAAAGLRSDAQGWLTRDALRIMLDLSPSELNILIFRARHQWKAELPELAELIERQRDAFRLASLPFEIRRGGIPEARYLAPTID